MDHQTIDIIIKLIISAAAAVTAWYTALKPLLAMWAQRKQQRIAAIEKTLKDDKEYREKVLEKLDDLAERINHNDISLSLVQKENIERAYCMFVIEHGYCPSGMKRAIAETYQFYVNHYESDVFEDRVIADRVDEILALPEFPPKKE